MMIVNVLDPEVMRSRLLFGRVAKAQHPTWNLEEAGGVASLHIYGVIGSFWGDVSAAEIVPAIRDLDVATLNVFINSPGGDVYDGIAIRNALRQHPADVVVTVDGLAASAASFIACAGDTVIMAENSELMVHDAWTIALGNAEEFRGVAADLDRISDNIAGMYAAKAGGDAADWRAVMKAETWYSAGEAVAAGLADRISTDDRDDEQPAAARFDLSMFAHAGRAAAPAPIPAAAMAAPREKETRMNRAQLAAALKAGTITQEQYDTAISVLDAVDGTTDPVAQLAPASGVPGEAVAAEYAAGPQQVAPAGRTEDRPRSFAQVAGDIVAAASTRDLRAVVQTVNNALETVGTGNDEGEAFYGRPAWIGEIWQAETTGRPWIRSLGGTSPLTSDSVEGFVWVREDETDEWESGETPANVEVYAGNFAEVPTGTWRTKKVTAASEQWGFGTKVDNIFPDLGSPDLIASLFGKLGANYDRNSDAHVRSKILTAAGSATSAGTVLAGIKGIAFDLLRVGANLSSLWLAEDLYDDFADLKVSDLPAWLVDQLGVDLSDATAKISDKLSFKVDFDLTSGTMIGYDRRAFTARESRQIKLQAIDISHRATDIGFFAYGGTLANDTRAIRKYSVELS